MKPLIIKRQTDFYPILHIYRNLINHKLALKLCKIKSLENWIFHIYFLCIYFRAYFTAYLKVKETSLNRHQFMDIVKKVI